VHFAKFCKLGASSLKVSASVDPTWLSSYKVRRAWCNDPFGETTQISMIFCISNSQKSGQICRFHWTSKRQKCFSCREATPTDPVTRGSAPGPPRGLRPQTRFIGLRSAFVTCIPPLSNSKLQLVLDNYIHKQSSTTSKMTSRKPQLKRVKYFRWS